MSRRKMKFVRKTVVLPRKVAKILEQIFRAYEMSFSEGMRMMTSRYIELLAGETAVEKTILEAITIRKKIMKEPTELSPVQ